MDAAPPPKKRRAPSPSVPPLPSACLPRPKRPRLVRSRPDARRRRVTKTQVPLVAGPTAGLPRPRTAPVRVVQATPPVRVANTAPPPLRGVTPRAKDPTFDLEPISTPSAYMMPIHEAGLDLFRVPDAAGLELPDADVPPVTGATPVPPLFLRKDPVTRRVDGV